MLNFWKYVFLFFCLGEFIKAGDSLYLFPQQTATVPVVPLEEMEKRFVKPSATITPGAGKKKEKAGVIRKVVFISGALSAEAMKVAYEKAKQESQSIYVVGKEISAELKSQIEVCLQQNMSDELEKTILRRVEEELKRRKEPMAPVEDRSQWVQWQEEDGILKIHLRS
jgi:hypothetical protein